MIINKNSKLTYVFPLLIAIIAFLMTPGLAISANFPLEIINIKPAGTGDPPIPESNRIFRAYPGIEYNIRAAVIGGLYPYTFSLENAPEGMTVDPDTGEISWPNPQSDAGPITLKVIDEEGSTISTQWSIKCTKDNFIFIDSDFSGTENGSFTNPYSSISNMMDNTDSNDRTDIVYFREGDYTAPNSGENNLSNTPHKWIGYPGETVKINGNHGYFKAQSSPVYLDSIDISNSTNYIYYIWGGRDYQTIRRCTWSEIDSDTSSNINQGMIMASSAGSKGYGFVVQDNKFSNFTGANAIGSLYDGNKTIIEDNYIYNGGNPGLHSFCSPLGIKHGNIRYTIRHNKIIMPENATDFGIYNEQLPEDDNAEILFNFIKRKEHTDNALKFYYPEKVYIYRNTIVGNIYLEDESDNPYYFYNNVFIGALIRERGSADLTVTNNLNGTISDNIINSDGLLTNEYSEYKGTHGWEIVNKQSLELESPENLKISN